MTPFQNSLLEFFEVRHAAFVKWLPSAGAGAILPVSDMVPLVTQFLDAELRKELGTYQKGCIRHRQIIDLLIEAHVVKAGTDFRDRLHQAALGVITAGKAN